MLLNDFIHENIVYLLIDYTYGDFVSILVWFCELCLGVACGTQLWGRGLGKHQVSRRLY